MHTGVSESNNGVVVVPWMLTEIPFQIEFRSAKSDTGFTVYPNMQILYPDGKWVSEAVGNWGLDRLMYQVYRQRNWSDPFSVNTRRKLDARIRHYHRPPISDLGYPVSVDPSARFLIVGYPLEPRKMPSSRIRKAIDTFLTLDLSPGKLSTPHEREVLYNFARLYGLWVPFEPLSTLADRQGAATIDGQATMSAIQETWRKLDDEFGPFDTDDEAEIGDRWTGPKLAFEPMPYLSSQGLEHSCYAGKWLYWPELMKVWHEAARIIHIQLDVNEMDRIGRNPLKAMRMAAFHVDQQAERGGDVSRLKVIERSNAGSFGAAALIEHFDNKMMILDEPYVRQQVANVLKEYSMIGEKIAIAERRANGEENPAVPTIQSINRPDEDDAVATRLLALIDEKESTHQLQGLTKREISEFRTVLLSKTNEGVRLDSVERDADARIQYREYWKRELIELTALRDAVCNALSDMRKLEPVQAAILEIRFVEDVKYEETRDILKQRGMSCRKEDFEKAHRDAVHTFARLCNIASLKPKEKGRATAGRRKANLRE